MKENELQRRHPRLLFLASVGFLFLAQLLQARADTDPKYYAVQASAIVQASPPQITLQWPADPNATGYIVSRKELEAGSWGTGTSLNGSATSFTDTAVQTGHAYEYQISKSTSPGYAGYGYVCAGIQADLIESRGKLILIVDGLYAQDLTTELARLQQDLVGDGWIVLRHDVSRTDSPAHVKSIITGDYAADPSQVRAVFLFGHVPVPYSGNLNPDNHPDHQGAWPTDAYYGDMDGSWTDNSVNNTSAQRQANWNVPGDGKFDQSELPSDVELEVGRVDLANMTCFSNKTPARSEKDLLRQYLNKDHAFRHGLTPMRRRGIVCDNFGERSGEAFAASGWRNFSAFFGADQVVAVAGWNYFSAVASESYLWSYGCGGGSYYTCDGIGSSDDFARTDIKSVFTMFLGSYFGDWDNESNFLRAPLGSSSCALAVAWAGRPHWFLHHMGLGRNIGYSTRLSQNNRNGGLYSAQNYATHNIHVGLLGDPTLRLHPVLPPSSVTGTPFSTGITLNWKASTDSSLLGYYVYRANSPAGPFTRISGSSPLAQTSFTDPTTAGGKFTYMVRAIKLETSGSGSYLNPSQGIFYSAGSGGSDGTVVPPFTPPPSAPAALTATASSGSKIVLTWADTASDELGFKVERKAGTGSFSQVAVLGPNATNYTDATLAAGTQYTYRVYAYSPVGESQRSNEATTSTPAVPSVPAAAAFVRLDSSSQGNWVGRYGAEGYALVGTSANYPAYASVTPNGQGDWIWTWLTSEARALELGSPSDRIAAAWYSTHSFSVDINFGDGQPHQLAIYCVDWDSDVRRQTVDVLDAASGSVLDTQSISNFRGGVYLVWNLSGHVVLKVTRNAGANAVLNGLFLDPSGAIPEAAAVPAMTPNGGSYGGPVEVTMASPTPGALMRYTLDGSEPTDNSPEFAGRLTVSSSATVRAKAFVSGMSPSATASATFVINGISAGQAQALVVRTDSTTRGNWKGVYGSEGYYLAGDPSGPVRNPGYLNLGLPQQQLPYVWTDNTPDVRALQQANADRRVAGCWFDHSALEFDLDLNDGKTHRVALYCLDWDRRGRAETVELLDAASGALITRQSLTSFGDGKYLVWDIKGHVRVRVSNSGGNNAVVMGLFFSAATIQLGTEESGYVSVGARGPTPSFRVSGQSGERFSIQGSTDLLHWDVVKEITLQNRSLDFVDPNAARYRMRFYRALPSSGGH